jgi:hypothetical protein
MNDAAKSPILNRQSQIANPKSPIPNRQSQIANPKSPVNQSNIANCQFTNLQSAICNRQCDTFAFALQDAPRPREGPSPPAYDRSHNPRSSFSPAGGRGQL